VRDVLVHGEEISQVTKIEDIQWSMNPTYKVTIALQFERWPSR
jgi:hypothetical protein